MGKIKLAFGISMKINVGFFVEKQVFLQKNRIIHLFLKLRMAFNQCWISLLISYGLKV